MNLIIMCLDFIGYRVETVYCGCLHLDYLFFFFISLPAPPSNQLLLKIHQKLQVSSLKPPGLNFPSARLFDEHGQEIKNPLLLKNEQKIWVSYGKLYR